MRQKTNLFLIILLLLFTATIVQAADQQPQLIRIGIFPLEPLNFFDQDNQASGLFPDLLRQMLKDEEWRLQFTPCSWAECLAMLQSGQIDLMTTIAHSDKRAEIMDFSQKPLVNIWGQIFTRPNENINNILDLEGKRVAIMARDLNGQNFQETAEKFGINYKLIELPTHDDVFEAVRTKTVDAGVAPQHFGLRHAGDYNLVGSSIIFSPFSVYFAAKKGVHPELLHHLDKHLTNWKKDKDSYYYQRLAFWMGGKDYESGIVPSWLKNTLYLGTTLTMLLLFLNRALNLKVKRKTCELQASESQYRSLVESANSIILRWDKKGRIIFINDCGVKLFGFSEEELIGEQLTGTIVPETHSSSRNLKAMIAEIQHSPEKYAINENENVCRDGQHLFIQWTNRAIIDSHGELKEILSIGTNITPRKEAQKELLREKLFSDSVINSLPGLFYVFEDGERLIRWNKNLEVVFEQSAHELVNISPQSWTKEKDTDKLTKMKEEVFFSGYAITELDLVIKGTSTPYFMSGCALRMDGRKYLIGIGLDLSGQKKLEDELLQAQKMEAIGTLAGGIAHDFNNILTAIFGFAELAKLDVDNHATVKRYIDEVIQGAGRARDLVQQILTFSRKKGQEKQPLQVSILTKEALKMLRASIPTTIDIRHNINSDKTVLADPAQIHQIIMNLCTNAYHAMRETGGVLAVSLSEIEVHEEDLPGIDLAAGLYLHLEVSDTGAGFDQEVMQKIFDPYFTTKKEGEGTGLGLAVVHGIVKSHNGAIKVYSTPGQGTTFHIYLPVTEKTSSPNLTDKSNSKVTGGSERIMFVDDEERIARVSKMILTKYGYQVDTFTNGVQAIQEFSRSPEQFDLVITDMTMPYMTGHELAQQILKISPRLPIILCTGHSELINRQKALAVGISEYLEKPVLANNLLEVVRKLLDAKVS